MTIHSSTSSLYEGVPLVGTMGTYYDSPGTRFELALETAERYRDAGVPLVAIDASPLIVPEGSNVRGAWVEDALKSREVTVIRADKAGIATQARQGVGFAVRNGAEKVIRHEPEKTLTVAFGNEIVNALDFVDVLVVGRTPGAEASLPTEQLRTERLAGWILQKTLNMPPDSLSGGRGYTAAGADTLLEYPAEEAGMNNWIYLYENVLSARAKGLRVGGIAIDLMHPAAMVKEEQGNPHFSAKRHMQFNLQLAYLLRRPEVEDSEGIAAVVLEGLGGLPMNATVDTVADYRKYFDQIEHQLAQYGYEPKVTGR